MRKQYNFWPGERGLDVWDVDRLIELSRDLPVQALRLDSIGELDSEYWFKDGQRPTVRAVVEHFVLLQAANLVHPILLAVDGRVMDGMHRIAKALAEGRETINAVQFQVQPEPDYRNVRPEELPYGFT